MSTYTEVDLSKLPPPDVIKIFSFEEIFNKNLSRFRQFMPEYNTVSEADPVYKILQATSYEEYLLREEFNNRLRSVMLAYAEKSDLDHLGALFCIERFVLVPEDKEKNLPAIMESDEEFKKRIQLSPEGYSVAGPKGAYEFHALNSDEDVLDASAISPRPGEVEVFILSRQGTGEPSKLLLDKVEGILKNENLRPMTDLVTVKSVKIIDYKVDAKIFTFDGPDSVLVINEAKKRLTKYIDSCYKIGRDVARSGISGALHIDGVQRVELNQPANDILLTYDSVARCTGVTITDGGIDD